MITTVAYKIARAPPVYALEGSVAVAGAALSWLRDNMQLLSNITQTQDMAERVRCSGDVYFVPAFSGLYAPYWQQDARGYCIFSFFFYCCKIVKIYFFLIKHLVICAILQSNLWYYRRHTAISHYTSSIRSSLLPNERHIRSNGKRFRNEADDSAG